jgi:hypothetical protein
MGKKKDQATLPDPFGLATGDELVDNALGRVEKVPKLCFPHDEGIGVGHGEAQIETHNRVLGQGAITDRVRCLIGVKVVERAIGGLVLVLVMQDVVTMTENFRKKSEFNLWMQMSFITIC